MKRKPKRLVMLIIGIGLCIMSGCTKAKTDAAMQKAPDVKAEKTDDEDVYIPENLRCVNRCSPHRSGLFIT